MDDLNQKVQLQFEVKRLAFLQLIIFCLDCFMSHILLAINEIEWISVLVFKWSLKSSLFFPWNKVKVRPPSLSQKIGKEEKKREKTKRKRGNAENLESITLSILHSIWHFYVLELPLCSWKFKLADLSIIRPKLLFF